MTRSVDSRLLIFPLCAVLAAWLLVHTPAAATDDPSHAPSDPIEQLRSDVRALEKKVNRLRKQTNAKRKKLVVDADSPAAIELWVVEKGQRRKAGEMHVHFSRQSGLTLADLNRWSNIQNEANQAKRERDQALRKLQQAERRRDEALAAASQAGRAIAEAGRVAQAAARERDDLRRALERAVAERGQAQRAAQQARATRDRALEQAKSAMKNREKEARQTAAAVEQRAAARAEAEKANVRATKALAKCEQAEREAELAKQQRDQAKQTAAATTARLDQTRSQLDNAGEQARKAASVWQTREWLWRERVNLIATAIGGKPFEPSKGSSDEKRFAELDRWLRGLHKASDDMARRLQHVQVHDDASRRQSLQSYVRGMTQFAGRDYSAAVKSFTTAINLSPHDARYHYFRALARRYGGASPRDDDVLDDVLRGGALEKRGLPKPSVVSRSLERVQGGARLWLEDYRPRYFIQH